MCIIAFSHYDYIGTGCDLLMSNAEYYGVSLG